jgi:membrane-associated phospholipid phosphatase
MPTPTMFAAARPAAVTTALVCCALPFASPTELPAQQPAPAVTQQGRAIVRDSTLRYSTAGDSTARDSAKAFSSRPLRPPPFINGGDVVISVALTTAAAALIYVDRPIAQELQKPGAQSSAVLRQVADGVELIGSPGALAFGGSLYVVGLATRKRGLADVGWHTLEALAVSGQVTSLMKGLFGRSRPFVANGDVRDFDLGSGFAAGTRRSFPSGHTSAAFTFASVISAETAHRWPRAHRVVGPLAYAAATGTGLARMYHDKHWASDVALGAAVGTLAGRLVVRYAHGRPRNLIDRIALYPARER